MFPLIKVLMNIGDLTRIRRTTSGAAVLGVCELGMTVLYTYVP